MRRFLTWGGAVMLLTGAGGKAPSAPAGAGGKAPSAPPAPRCVPSALNRSAVLPRTSLQVSPMPESLDASAYTQISLLGAPAAQLGHVRVSGSSTGVHMGRLVAYSQGDGASFLPAKPFRQGETVTVRGSVGAQAFAFRFTVAEQNPLRRPPMAIRAATKPGEVQRFHSRPDLQPPAIAVTAPASPQTAPGYVLASPYSGPGQDGPMIFDNSGQTVWFESMPYGIEATNLQVQSFEGRPVLTWWQGFIPSQGFGEGVEMLADGSYHQSVVRAGNGYWADLHDFHITPQASALLTIFNPVRCDLSKVGGPRAGAVTDGVFQELDLRSGLVRREWHSLDHVPISDSYSSRTRATTQWPWDYFHINSIDLHQDGTVLLSARNTSALYLLGSQGGQVMVRVGGRHSTVKLGPGTATAYQHDATLLPNGDISVFDNGGVPKVHPQSRGILVAVNPQAGTDTLVAQFTHPRPLSSGSQGNIQGLPGGDFFVGWGPVPYFSEFNATGGLLFDAHMPPGYQSYRGYRFPWMGTPREAPAIAVAPAAATAGPSGALDVYASWNGATQVAAWRVLGGASSHALAPVASAPRGGFETTIPTPGAVGYVAVQALDASGAVLGTSRVIKG